MNKIENCGEDAAQDQTTSSTSQSQNSDKTESIINQYAINWFTLVEKSVEESLNFKEILQLFNCAISQEQAWAVLNQCLIELRYILENNLELIKLNQEKIDINIIYFVKDGSILFDFDKLQQNSNASSSKSSCSSISSEKHTVEMKVLRSVAYLIFDALDYGNNYSNEPALQNSLENLLILMSGHYKEFNNNRVSEDDEGYEQEDEDIISVDKAIEICTNNVPEPEYHYKAVCRGLYAQAYELKAFLAKIELSKHTIQKSGQDTTHYCFEVLDKTDWAKLWMQVIHELRNGVKLRKVYETHELLLRRHIEYELTPFEILLDQIRARRYRLKKVTLDKSIGPEIKKDARDIILDFIRSRPPLKNSSKRNLKPKIIKKDEPINLHEQLMNSIRNYSTPLRKINETLNLTDNQNESKQQKRLLKADKKLLNNLTSSDDDESDIDDEELQNLSILQEDFTNTSNITNQNFKRNSNFTGSLNYSSSRKRRIKAPDSLKSPLAPWCEPDENWRSLVTEDILFDTNNKLDQSNTRVTPTRRHTMNMADFKSLSSLFKKKATISKKAKVSDRDILKNKLTTTYMKSGPGQFDFGYVDINELIKKITTEGNILSLTFEELCHIRSVLTKAELDYLLFDTQLFQDVSKGKVCFSCRKTKFHLFYWGCKCRICQQRVCKKCLRTACLKNGQIAQVPLFKLCPNKFSDNNINSRNSNSSMSSQTTNEEIDQVALSNEKLSKDETIFNQDLDNETQMFDVCVDCYQMINGLKVNANNLEIKQVEIKTINQNARKILESSVSDSPLNAKSSHDITMLSLNHISSINNNSSSPYFNKILCSSHHSTPTPLATPIIKSHNNNLSSIILNEISNDFDLYKNINEKQDNNVCRQNLTLDLQPVYSKTSS